MRNNLSIYYLMKQTKVIVFLFLIALAACDNWAVLVAGSHTWSNYRHQSDIYHAYQVLIKGGFDANRIITLAYNDIANHLTNPFKGKVYNKPTYTNPGVDVYAGVSIDYQKLHVTPAVFQAVLEGNKSFVTGKGSGRVVQSTSADNIFIFFSDHGAPGLIAFPHENLYADHLLSTFAKMQGKYKKMVFYLESCQSGSMFQKLPKDTGIYALSAASPSESSWGCYCSPDDVVNGKHIGSCLGDLFAVSFVEDTEKGNYDSETLNEQFQIIHRLTTKSQVMQWGDLSFQNDKIGQFLTGNKKTGINIRLIKPIPRFGTKAGKRSVMDSRTNKLQSLAAIYARDHSPETFAQMSAEIKSMQMYENAFNRFSKRFNLNGKYDAANINFDCLRAAINGFQQRCGKFSDYGLGFIKYFSQGCQNMSADLMLSQIVC